MGRVIMNGPPPGSYCVICLMTAKQRQWEAHQDEIQAGYAAGGDKLTVIPWLPGLTDELLPGDYRGVAGDAPMLGMVDGLCWTHLAGINPQPVTSQLDTQTKLPPELIKKGPRHGG